MRRRGLCSLGGYRVAHFPAGGEGQIRERKVSVGVHSLPSLNPTLPWARARARSRCSATRTMLDPTTAPNRPTVPPSLLLLLLPLHRHVKPPLCGTAKESLALSSANRYIRWSQFGLLANIIPAGGSMGLDDKLFLFPR